MTKLGTDSARNWTPIRHFCVAVFLVACAPERVAMAIDDPDPVWEGFSSSFSTPLTQFIDGTAEESLAVTLALDLPLKSPVLSALGGRSQGDAPSSPTLQAGFKYVPLTAWFLNMTFYRYLYSDQQAPWNPDFTYSFGYDDWNPYTISMQYANYGGNRLNPDKAAGENRTSFSSGTWSLGYKFPLPKSTHGIFVMNPKDDSVGCNLGFHLTPRYSDLASGQTKGNKKVLSFGCKYGWSNNWYFNFTLNHYPNQEQQQPWDPDYTYGFGYFDWRPGTWSIQYNNYSGNRFPWRSRSQGTGRLKDGSLTISYGWKY